MTTATSKEPKTARIALLDMSKSGFYSWHGSQFPRGYPSLWPPEPLPDRPGHQESASARRIVLAHAQVVKPAYRERHTWEALQTAAQLAQEAYRDLSHPQTFAWLAAHHRFIVATEAWAEATGDWAYAWRNYHEALSEVPVDLDEAEARWYAAECSWQGLRPLGEIPSRDLYYEDAVRQTDDQITEWTRTAAATLKRS